MPTVSTPSPSHTPRLSGTARTSISVSERVYRDALSAASRHGYRSFSGYLEELMRRDAAALKRSHA